MTPEVDYATKARLDLETLCGVQPNRRPGSAGNRAATDFFAERVRVLGWQADATPFACLDHVSSGAALVRGEEQYDGDHMIFVQSGIPALACTSENMGELMRSVTHTPQDRPEIVDCDRPVEVAQALAGLVRTL